MIFQLNPKIKGWSAYHRHVCSKRTFRDVDDAIFKQLWRWCCRRHPKKPQRWVSRRYFTSVPRNGGGNNWVFNATWEDVRGELRRVHLTDCTRTRIRRHVKIKSDVNPYDPEWRDYLAARHRRRQPDFNHARDASPQRQLPVPRPSTGR